MKSQIKKSPVQKKTSSRVKEFLTRGVDTIYPSKEDVKKALTSGKKLRLYLGVDPTGDKLHIGHTVALWKLRQFQDIGHTAILMIGDFTGMIGDPSGKLKTRGGIRSREEILANAKTYKDQASKIVRFSGNNPAELRFNSEWNSKLTLHDWLIVSSKFTLQQLEERDMFVERKKKGEPILISEFQYPLIQAHDFVALNADIQIGGTDQTFNMLAGRTLAKITRKKNVFVMTVPLLTDASGRKIGKTEGNVIGITDPPKELFGKIMALPDSAIIPCFELITSLPMKQVNDIKKSLESKTANPMEAKKRLARTMVSLYYSEKEADDARQHFECVFQKRSVPKDILTYTLGKKHISIVDFLCDSGLATSRSHAKRQIAQGSIDVDGQTVKRVHFKLFPGMTIQVGKRKFVKLIV